MGQRQTFKCSSCGLSAIVNFGCLKRVDKRHLRQRVYSQHYVCCVSSTASHFYVGRQVQREAKCFVHNAVPN